VRHREHLNRGGGGLHFRPVVVWAEEPPS
jgi:hypothetical protein